MFTITSELLTALGLGGVLLLIFGYSAIRTHFSSAKENAKNAAEKSLYDNLAAENKRMSDMLANMSHQLNTLLIDNNRLLNRVADLERDVKSLGVHETNVVRLTKMVEERDNTIAALTEELLSRG